MPRIRQNGGLYVKYRRIKRRLCIGPHQAGKAMMIYNNLGLDKLDCCVAIIKNARSNKKWVKNIIKIEGGLDLVDLDVLGFIDHNITVNIIKDSKIVEKKRLSLPKKITNVIKCKNPLCIILLSNELKAFLFDRRRKSGMPFVNAVKNIPVLNARLSLYRTVNLNLNN